MNKASSIPDPDKIEIRLPALVAKQPIGDLYVSTVDSSTIERVTYFDVRRVIQQERDIERYLGIQRPLNEGRLKDLFSFVNFLDATFPTSVIVALDGDYATFDEETSSIILSNCREGESEPSIPIREIGKVIDGQHRIRSLAALNEGKDFDIIVTFFVGSDVSDQSYVFATVNLEQTKVNKSLAYDLYDLAKTRSPLKTCHNIAVAFDNTEGNPFYKRIKRLGVATPGRDNKETITQSTFVNGLVPYISASPKDDRDMLLRGRTPPKVAGKDLDKMPLRNLFLDEEDVKIGRIYEAYFSAVSVRWKKAWEYEGTGIMLARTNGYRAFSAVFGRIYRKITGPGSLASVEAFKREFDKVDLNWDDFNTERFPPGSSGESLLKRTLLQSIFPE